MYISNFCSLLYPDGHAVNPDLSLAVKVPTKENVTMTQEQVENLRKSIMVPQGRDNQSRPDNEAPEKKKEPPPELPGIEFSADNEMCLMYPPKEKKEEPPQKPERKNLRSASTEDEEDNATEHTADAGLQDNKTQSELPTINIQQTVDETIALSTAEKRIGEGRTSKANAKISEASQTQTKPGPTFGLSIPLSDKAVDEIYNLKTSVTNYVQLYIDQDNEVVGVENPSTCTVQQLPNKVPEDVPRYHLFRFSHIQEGQKMDDMIFILTMPCKSCSMIEKILYKSCQSGIISDVENLGVKIDKQVEVDSRKSLAEEFLQDELHSQISVIIAKFSNSDYSP